MEMEMLETKYPLLGPLPLQVIVQCSPLQLFLFCVPQHVCVDQKTIFAICPLLSLLHGFWGWN